jgi:ATP-dependent Clp protease ATP-binding subunit ClpC
VLREEKAHFSLVLPLADSKETICRQIEEHSVIREKVPMNSKLPLSDECERALGYAEEEAAYLSRERVAPEHLLLGLLREEGSFAAQLLREHGADLERIRRELAA